jgi:tetratricopeptide (TPR) repeat protein
VNNANFLARAEILHRQRRFALEEQELNAGLALQPADAVLHTRLSLCLYEQSRLKEAMSEARVAIGLNPELPAAYFALARALSRRSRYKESRAAIVEAFRLGANEACYFSQLTVIEMHEKHWQAALDTAERGLTLDPLHAGCNVARVRALLRLGRTKQANQAAKAALADAPDTAFAQLSWGWMLLKQGELETAIGHFQEALRINPELESARSSLLGALKARYWTYRFLLGLSGVVTSTAKQPGWALALFAMVVLPQLHGSHDPIRLGQTLLGIAVLFFLGYGFFLGLTGIREPLFHGVLLMTKAGRPVVSQQQRAEAKWVWGLIMGGLFCIAVAIINLSRQPMLGALTCGALAAMVAAVHSCQEQRSKRITLMLSAVCGCSGLAAISLLTAMQSKLVNELVTPNTLTTILLLTLAAALIVSRHFPALVLDRTNG